MVKIKIEKWGNLQGLSISISQRFIYIVVIILGIIFSWKELPSFLKIFNPLS